MKGEEGDGSTMALVNGCQTGLGEGRAKAVGVVRSREVMERMVVVEKCIMGWGVE